MRAVFDGGDFFLEEMLLIGLQLGLGKNLTPTYFSFGKIVSCSVRRGTPFDRAHVGIVSFEVIGIDFNLSDRTRPPEFQNNPVVAGTTAAFRLPPVAHVFGTTGHD